MTLDIIKELENNKIICSHSKEEITEYECSRRRIVARKTKKFIDAGYTAHEPIYYECLNCKSGWPEDNNSEFMTKEDSPMPKPKIDITDLKCLDCGKSATDAGVKFNVKYNRCQYHAQVFRKKDPNYTPRKYNAEKSSQPHIASEASKEPQKESSLKILKNASVVDYNFCPYCGATLTKPDSLEVSITTKAHKVLNGGDIILQETDSKIIKCTRCWKKL